MSRGWKVWLFAGLIGVPALLPAQTLPEPPPLSTPSTAKPSVSTNDKPSLPPPPRVSESADELPPLPPGLELTKPATSGPSDAVPPSTPPSRLISSTDKPAPSKPSASGKPDNGLLPHPTPFPTKPEASRHGPVVPDISGMPGGDDTFRPASWPPSVPAPVAPVPMPTPPPPPDHVGGPSGWVVFGDVLFWRPRLNEPQLLIAQVPTPNNIVIRAVPWDGDYELAFRAGLGYLFSGGVYIWGEYTHFDNLVTTTSFTLPASPPHVVIYNGPGLSHGATAGSNDSATISWDLRYHTVDIMAGSVLSPTEFFDLTLAAGARLAEITQRIDTSGSQGGGIVSGRERFQLDIEGAGPRLGLESRLYLWRGQGGWSLTFYGRSYAALLFADVDETIEAVQTSGGVITQRISGASSTRQILPQVELALGGEWSLLGGRLIVAGGYEWIYWFDAASSNFSAFSASGNVQHQNLSFDGPFIRAILLW